MGMHRTSCKMFSILLGLFTTLAEKGFCLPEELEVEKGNATEFQDIQDGGLGDGDGMKDISENIKTEDQLEDAMKEGEEKKEESEFPDLKDEKGIEMSEDFEGKLHEPDTKGSESSDGEEEDNEDDSKELDKKMGEVGSEQSDNINEKLWGSDDEEEDKDLDEDEDGGGTTQNDPSQLAAKDETLDEEQEKPSDSGRKSEKSEPDQKNEEEYDGEHPDPMIDKPPDNEPEIIELSDEMQLDGDASGDEGEETDKKLDIDDVKEYDENPAEEEEKPMDDADDTKNEMEVEDSEMPADQEDVNENKSGQKQPDPETDENDTTSGDLPQSDETCPVTMSTSKESEAMSADDGAKHTAPDSVHDSEDVMDWDGGSQETSEQHQEGQADSHNSQAHDTGHEGEKLTSAHTMSEETKENRQRLKPSDESRSLGSAHDAPVEKVPVTEKKATENPSSNPTEVKSHIYEHVKDGEIGDTQTVDIATAEQATEETVPQQQQYIDDDDDDVIALDDSDDDITEAPQIHAGRTLDDNRGKGQDNLNVGDEEENRTKEIQGEIVSTLGVSRGPDSTIHTQHDLWSAMSAPGIEKTRKELAEHLDLWSQGGKQGMATDFHTAQELWHQYEDVVSPLVQELCEQLRLVLEPTKMTKLKGDYRTGKRLNMRKIIPYIASQFRKDKIWLRRTKPSKRQYQIMLAVDDSSSMADNQSKQLAFESLALIGKSLCLLEAGDLAIVNFGESVRLLHSFSEKFSDLAGAHILQEFTFAQKKTAICDLVEYATSALVKARSGAMSGLVSKEIVQLLLIISDGRGLYNEGEERVRDAVRKARDNNIFMVFIVLDNPQNKDSILDIKTPVFNSKGELVEMKSYIEKFPFPFYILMREISSLPLVLGEALRQWFELVTSVER